MPMTVVPPPERLLDRHRGQIRYLHHSIRTEQADVHWARPFGHFHGLGHPLETSDREVEHFLAWLATERQVYASAHKQALLALLLVYPRVLGQQLPWMEGFSRPRSDPRMPVVLAHDAVAGVLTALDADHRLFGPLLCGTGLRLLEGLRLRVKGIDFACRARAVCKGEGSNGQVVMLPASLKPPLRRQLAAARARGRAAGAVWLPACCA